MPRKLNLERRTITVKTRTVESLIRKVHTKHRHVPYLEEERKDTEDTLHCLTKLVDTGTIGLDEAALLLNNFLTTRWEKHLAGSN